MRIWIINHYGLPPTTAGGTRHYHFARQLRQRGHDVTIIAANYNHFTHSFIPTNAKLGEIDNTYEVPFIWIPTPKYRGNTIARFWNMLLFSWRLLQKKYLSTLEPPEVIIGSSPHLFSAFSAELLACRLKIPFLLEIRDIWPDTLVELGRFTSNHPLIKLMKWIELRLYKRAKHIICLLPSADQYLIKCGVNPACISWLPNAIDTDIIPRNFAHKTKDKFTIMYAGAHGLANDLDTVLDAAMILQERGLGNDIRICLVGDGPEKSRLKYRVQHEKLGMVEFMDPVPKNEIYSVLSQADIFLMLLKSSPLFRWGISPNKLFDYLIMGRPIIFGVDTPFNPIEKHNAGISINPSDAESLASAINKLSLLPKKELDDMGSRGKSFVLQQHHILNLIGPLETIIMNCVK